MEKKTFNHFSLRWKLPFHIVAGVILITIAAFIGYEYFFETLEIKDLGSLFSLQIIFLGLFLLEYKKKITVSDKGIHIQRPGSKKSFIAWDEIKSVGTFKTDNWGKFKPAPEKEGGTNSMFISKAEFEKISHTFLNKPNQTFKLPFNTELYNLVKQKVTS